MRAGEDEERELIATVRNLLTQSRKPGSSGEEVASSPPGDQPGEEEVREEAVLEDGGQPDPSPAPAPRGAGIRSLIDSVLGSGGAGQRRASGNGDPARALLERIGESGAESGGEDATSPEAVEDMETEPEMPASPPERRDPFGIFAGRKKEADTSAPNDPGAATADEPVIPARGHRASPGLPDLEVEEEPETDENISVGVVSVDELGNLADLILPKGATFEVEELHIKRNERQFDFVDNARVVSEFDELFTEAFSSATLAAAAAATEVPVEDVPEPRFGFLERFHLPKTVEVIEEYNPVLHGPLVDLSMRPSPGLEEIELYPVNEPYAYVRVTYDSTTHEYTYNVLEPVLTPGEQELFGEIKERLFETLDITTRDLTRDEARKALRDAANTIIADYGIRLEPPGREKILYHVEKEFLGDGLIDPVMHDGYIEDISCDGVGSAIFVYHTTYESMKTSLIYRDAAELDSFVTKLAQRAGKYISIAEPMLDATMSDGSRIQMTLGSEVTAHGSTFTIRKFREEPITPTDLIEWHTFSPLGIAFLWLAVENAKSCIFAGGTASGKTTTLNAISLFIPPLAKIVTLEDTRELKLPHPNWIPSITRDSFSQDGRGEIDMYELLRAALRQRPEYILVGEVRGSEARTLFQAMNTGHTTFSTMHAGGVDAAIHRLENEPLNVPRNMLQALDVISVQALTHRGYDRVRRCREIVELAGIDPITGSLQVNTVYEYNPVPDTFTYSGRSRILGEIMEYRGWSRARLDEELQLRRSVLLAMQKQGIRDYRAVARIVQAYAIEPDRVLASLDDLGRLIG